MDRRQRVARRPGGARRAGSAARAHRARWRRHDARARRGARNVSVRRHGTDAARRDLPHRVADETDHRRRHDDPRRRRRHRASTIRSTISCPSWPIVECCAASTHELDDTVPAIRAITVEDLLTFRLGFGNVMAPPGTYPIQVAEADLQLRHARPTVATAAAHARRVDRDGWDAAADAPARRGVDVQRGLAGARGAHGAGRGQAARGLPPGAPLRAARHDRHRLQRAARNASSVHDRVRARPGVRACCGVLDRVDDSWWSNPPQFANGAGWLVSTLDDFWSFVQLLLHAAHTTATGVLSERVGRAHDHGSPHPRAATSGRRTVPRRRAAGDTA